MAAIQVCQMLDISQASYTLSHARTWTTRQIAPDSNSLRFERSQTQVSVCCVALRAICG